MTEIMLELSHHGSSSPKTKVSKDIKTERIVGELCLFRSFFRKAKYPPTNTVADTGKRTALANLRFTSRLPPRAIPTILFSTLWD